MKFGFLLFDYFPFGGLERDCVRIASACVARGHQATIFTRTWQGERPTNITVELFGRHGFTNTLHNRHWLNQLRNTLPKWQLDCVVGFNKLPGLDVYFGADPCFADKLYNRKPFWYRWMPRGRQLLELERAVFARDSKTEILQLTPREIPKYKQFYGTDQKRFHILPATATRHHFTAGERNATRKKIREAQGWFPQTKLVLFVGSAFRRKGLDRAITGLASLDPKLRNQTQFAVLGQCDAANFAQLARPLGISERVHFLGGRDDVTDWMLAADVLVHPARSETAGTVLVEALACGLPVLVTEICGYAFHVAQAKAGVTFTEPFDQKRFNDALEIALTSPIRETWEANALAYAAKGEIFGCHERAAEIIEAVALRSTTVKKEICPPPRFT